MLALQVPHRQGLPLPVPVGSPAPCVPTTSQKKTRFTIQQAIRDLTGKPPEYALAQADAILSVFRWATSRYEPASSLDASTNFINLKNQIIKTRYHLENPLKSQVFVDSKDSLRIYLKLPSRDTRNVSREQKTSGAFKVFGEALCITFSAGREPTFEKVARLTVKFVTDPKVLRDRPKINEHRVKEITEEARRLCGFKGENAISQILDWARYTGKDSITSAPRSKVVMYQKLYTGADLEKANLSTLSTSSGSRSSESASASVIGAAAQQHARMSSEEQSSPHVSEYQSSLELMSDGGTERVPARPSLASSVARPLTTLEMARLFRDIVTGVKVIHDRGMVHRDMKPANVFVEETPSGPHLVVGDLGLAKNVIGVTNDGGTERYFSPERMQEHGTLGFPMDVWSTAMVLYWMLHRQPNASISESHTPRSYLMCLRRDLAKIRKDLAKSNPATSPTDPEHMLLCKKISDTAEACALSLAFENITPEIRACINGQTYNSQELQETKKIRSDIQSVVDDVRELMSKKLHVSAEMKGKLLRLEEALTSHFIVEDLDLGDIQQPSDPLQNVLCHMLHPNPNPGFRWTIAQAKAEIDRIVLQEENKLVEDVLRAVTFSPSGSPAVRPRLSNSNSAMLRATTSPAGSPVGRPRPSNSDSMENLLLPPVVEVE